MPVALLRGFLASLARLEAEEMLKEGNVAAYGAGNMKQDDARSFVRRLQTEIAGASGQKPKFASPGDFARQAGFKVERTVTG